MAKMKAKKIPKKHFLVKALSNCYNFALLTAWFLTFDSSWNLSTNFIIELHVPQCLFVRQSNKKQRRGRMISNFTKEETFSSLVTTTCSWGLSHNVTSLLAPFKKDLHLPFSLAKKRTYLDTQLEGELTDLFENWHVPYCHE